MKKYISLTVSVLALMIVSVFAFSAYADDAVQLDKSNTSITLGYDEIVYGGKARTPLPEVKYTDLDTNEVTTLKRNTDYTVTYLNNVDAGTATVVIDGIGNYTGQLKANFKINPLVINTSSKYQISLSFTTTTFSGSAKTPAATIYRVDGDSKTKLQQNTDYTLQYKNNINIGRATVTIKGINNYTSTVTKTFDIIPQKVTGEGATNAKVDSVTVKWSKQSYVSGYQIYRYDGGKKAYVLIATVGANTTSYNVTGLKGGYAQIFRVRSYKKVDNKTNLYGAYSNVIKTATKPERVVLDSVGKSGKDKIRVSWNKVKCSGYQIYYSTDKNFKKNVKVVTINKPNNTAYTIKKVNNKRTYYVKVRGFLKYNNRTYNGTCSQYLSTNYGNLYATYYSYYENNPDRTTNLRIASKAISGTVVQPGQTFSFNSVVGPRTAARGYKNAHVFAGEQVVDGIGGGICQVASTMFNCALISNVKIVERHQHSQRVWYVPLGRDAAIFGTAEDFRWKNTTKYPIKIVMTVKDGVIRCSFYTCENIKPKKVSIKVSQSGKNFTMKRYVDGKVNYSCRSNY